MKRPTAAIALLAAALPLAGAGAPANVDWPSYGGQYDEAGYADLRQINRTNVARLGLAWSLDLPGEQSLEATPLAVGGVLYFTGSFADVYQSTPESSCGSTKCGSGNTTPQRCTTYSRSTAALPTPKAASSSERPMGD